MSFYIFLFVVIMLAVILASAGGSKTASRKPVRIRGRNNGEKCTVCSGDCGQCG